MLQKLFFENSKGNKLSGIISTFQKDKPIIILCHGFSSSKNSRTFINLEKKLNENKISTFRFDFSGHGESDGLFEEITISQAVDDILSAIKYLKRLDYNKIGLIGSSFGGISSIMAASKTNDLFVLGLKCPVSDYEETIRLRKSEEEMQMWKEVGFDFYIKKDKTALRLNYTFYEDFKNNNAYKAAEKINIPTLIVHGNNDTIVPINQSINTSKIIKNCKLEIINGANHFFSKEEEFEKMLNLLTDFIVNNS